MKPITRKEKIIAGEELTPITREEMFLKEYGGGASSWNDLTDKPFYESVSYGDTLSTNPIELSNALSGGEAVTDSVGMSVKVSDAIPTLNDLVNGVIIQYSEDEEFIVSYDDILSHNEQAPAGMLVVQQFVFISSDNFTTNDNGADLVFPEKGTYILIDYGTSFSLSLTIPGYNGFKIATVKKIDKKYLPSCVTKFYVLQGDDYIYTSSSASEESRAHSSDIYEAITRGTIVVYSVYEDGNIRFIAYPTSIEPGFSGCWIAVANSYNTYGYHTSDWEANVS